MHQPLGLFVNLKKGKDCVHRYSYEKYELLIEGSIRGNRWVGRQQHSWMKYLRWFCCTFTEIFRETVSRITKSKFFYKHDKNVIHRCKRKNKIYLISENFNMTSVTNKNLDDDFKKTKCFSCHACVWLQKLLQDSFYKITVAERWPTVDKGRRLKKYINIVVYLYTSELMFINYIFLAVEMATITNRNFLPALGL